jgi:hypothetical protein
MENEDKSVKRGNMGEEAPVQQNNHGFAIHSSGTLEDEEQEDKLSSTAENNDTNVKADLPPKINNTNREG